LKGLIEIERQRSHTNDVIEFTSRKRKDERKFSFGFESPQLNLGLLFLGYRNLNKCVPSSNNNSLKGKNYCAFFSGECGFFSNGNESTFILINRPNLAWMVSHLFVSTTSISNQHFINRDLKKACL